MTETHTGHKYTLREMRKRSGLSGAIIVKLCNTTYPSLRNWEKGTSMPNIVTINNLLDIYGYSYYELDLSPFYDLIGERPDPNALQELEVLKNMTERNSAKKESTIKETSR